MKWLIGLIAVVCLLICSSGLQALTISPDLVRKLQEKGAWDAFAVQFREMQQRLEGQTMPIMLKKDRAALSVDGTVTMRVVVILAEFVDNPAVIGVPGLNKVFFDTLLFTRNTTQPRSLTDFYLENSYGNLLIDGDVFGWYTMPQTYAAYVGTTNGLQPGEPNARTLARDAAMAADKDINFALYDNDGDLFVDALFVVHAGPGAEEDGSNTKIWSHHWTLTTSYLTGEGKYVSNYLMGPEEEFAGPTRIGVYCHEFGHILGLPDLYDVGTSPTRPGIGSWSLMAGGSWNGGGRWPAHFDGWCKHVLDSLHGGFGVTVNVAANLVDVVLGSAVHDSVRYRIMLPGANGKEYFLIENRQKEGFDRNLPGNGLAIFHCDDNLHGSNNSQLGHLHISLEQADGLFHLENNVNSGDANDLFPGPLGLHTEFTDQTIPSTSSFYSLPNEKSVWNIRENVANKTVTCNFDFSYSRPYIKLKGGDFFDITYGNGDGIFTPGERVEFLYAIRNYWKRASGVTVRMSSPVAGITFGSSTNHFDTIGTGQERNNYTAALDFTLDSSIAPTNARFDLLITTASPIDTFRIAIYKDVGGPTDVNDDFSDLSLPASFDLKQNYPNPFNPTTVISYVISPKQAGRSVSLDVYNVLGQRIAALEKGIARPGNFIVDFDATSQPSGIYFYRLTVGKESLTKKMVLIK